MSLYLSGIKGSKTIIFLTFNLFIMSYTIGDLVACPNLQARITQAWMAPNPVDVVIPSPLLQFLSSPLNRGGLQMSVSPGNGKIRAIDVVYDQKRTGTQSNVSVNATHPTCTASTSIGNAYTRYDIDPDENVQAQQLISLTDLIRNCQENGEYMAQQILALIRQADERVASVSAVQAAALVGGFGSETDNVTADVLAVRTLRSGTTDEIYPFAMQDIKTAARHSAYGENPYVIFSGDQLKTYADRMAIGCCSDTGADLTRQFAQFGAAVTYDYWVQNALGGQEFALMMKPGALQLLTFNLYAGANGMNEIITPEYSQRVVISPESGIPYDVMIKHDCGNFHLVVTGITKVVGLPTDMFPQGDQYQGVTWVNQIEVSNS